MSDFFSTAIEIQREILRAQKVQLDAAQKLLDGSREVAKLQEASQKAAEANLAVWKQWTHLWGWK